MPISSIVITLSTDALLRRAAIDSLSAHPRLTVGERQKHQLPVVVDTKTLSEGFAYYGSGQGDGAPVDLLAILSQLNPHALHSPCHMCGENRASSPNIAPTAASATTSVPLRPTRS